MKRSTLIIGLVICGVVYLFGRERAPFDPAHHAAARLPAIMPATAVPLPPATAGQVMASHMPDQTARLAALEREYRDHPGFRQLVADYNAETGHTGRGETASLEALDQDAMAGAPAFGLFQAVQPRAEMLRAMEHHWHDQRERRRDDTVSP